MAEEDRIFEGTYKQFPVYWKSSTTEGGRSLVVRQFPNRDTQNVEDTGLIPRKFSLKLCVFAAAGFGYFEYRDALIAVLETKGPGVFIHPLYGRLEGMASGTYSIQEDSSKFGDTTIIVKFEASNNTGIPKASGRAVSEVDEAVDELFSVTAEIFIDAWSIDLASTGNFADAVSKLEEVAAVAESAVSAIGKASAFVTEYKDKLTAFTDTITEKVAQASAVINDTLDLAQSAYNFVNDPRSRLATIAGFFGFGAGDIALVQNTIGRIQRFRNRNILNHSVNAATLGLAYKAAANISYDTVADIEYVRTILDDQYDAVRASDLPKEVKDAVANARSITLDILDQRQLTASQVVTIDTPETSFRLIAYDYYGNEAGAERLAKLNSTSEVSVVVGDVEILTA